MSVPIIGARVDAAYAIKLRFLTANSGVGGFKIAAPIDAISDALSGSTDHSATERGGMRN